MSANLDVTAARKRIESAYDPRLFAAAGQSLIELLAGHLAQVEQSEASVLNWADPRAYLAEATRLVAVKEKSEGGGERTKGEERRDKKTALTRWKN